MSRWNCVGRKAPLSLFQKNAHLLPSIGLALAMSSSAVSPSSPVCEALPESLRSRLPAHVAKLVKAPADLSIELLSADVENGTCFRRLEFKTSKSQRFTLFLSPDQRFLARQLFDLSVDPAVAEQKAIERTKVLIDEYIEKNRVPILGPAVAPTTIAVFSDFECPFCRRTMHILQQEVLPRLNARVAYMHYPLANHDWATQGALAMACIGKENAHAFWRVHDYIFEHQAEITPDSVAETVVAQAKRVMPPVADLDRFENCVRNKESAQRVQADADFGSSLGVAVTPTLFINGKRVTGVINARQVLEIAEALKSVPMRASGK